MAIEGGVRGMMGQFLRQNGRVTLEQPPLYTPLTKTFEQAVSDGPAYKYFSYGETGWPAYQVSDQTSSISVPGQARLPVSTEINLFV